MYVCLFTYHWFVYGYLCIAFFLHVVKHFESLKMLYKFCYYSELILTCISHKTHAGSLWCMFSGTIDFNDFLTIMTQKMSEKDAKEEILKAFRLFDDDETGKISFRNLKRVAKELGENLTDEELQVRNPNCLEDIYSHYFFSSFFVISFLSVLHKLQNREL